MTPQDFIRKWKTHALTERAAAQEHFIDLCRLLGHPTPAEDDPNGDHFTFEKGAAIISGGKLCAQSGAGGAGMRERGQMLPIAARRARNSKAPAFSRGVDAAPSLPFTGRAERECATGGVLRETRQINAPRPATPTRPRFAGPPSPQGGGISAPRLQAKDHFSQ
jgi:hypothetical protein